MGVAGGGAGETTGKPAAGGGAAQEAAAILLLWVSDPCAASGPSCPKRTTRDPRERSSRRHHGSSPSRLARMELPT